jgi:ribosomal protein S18 acetylase RimI-like enzyme
MNTGFAQAGVPPLIVRALDENPHLEPMLTRLDRAARQETSEALGLVASLGDTLVGVGLFGLVAGARGTAMLYGVAVLDELKRRGVGAALVRGMVKLLAAEKTRMLVAEVPDDGERTSGYRSFLRNRGFREEAEIPDFISDGVPLTLFRLDFPEHSS